MTFNPEDPKWTAYILGELEASERAEMESLLESSEEARAYLEELRSAAGALEHELKAGFPPVINAGLTEAQRNAVAAAAEAGTVNNIRWFRQPQAWVAGLAVAAMILIAVAVPSLWHSAPTGSGAESVVATNSTNTEQGIPASPAIQTATNSNEAEADRREEKSLTTPKDSAAKTSPTEEQTQAVPTVTAREEYPAQISVGRTFGASAGTNPGVREQQVPASAPQSTLKSANAPNNSTLVSPDSISPVSVEKSVLDVIATAPGGQTQFQGLQAGAPAGGGGGRGGGAAGAAPAGSPGTVAGRVSGIRGGIVGAAGAPPPPPAGPPPSPVMTSNGIRALSDNPPVLNYYDRPAAPGTASYAAITDNPFIRVSQDQLSTFSSDVDTASYANLRRFLNQNQVPPRDAVRIEEMINYFPYDYAQPSGRDPIGAQMEVASAPWSPSHRLVRIGIKARDIDSRRRPSSNLVFLIDVSGSMQPQERLPLIKSGLKMLVSNLTENDHVSMVVYAGASGVVLPSTSGDRKDVISRAIDSLEAGGSTNGGAGIQLAYQIAVSNFIPNGVNRVILATDGDFNVGVTNQGDLTRLIQERAKSGVFLSVLGVGTDNLKDSTMERLADNGNGNYAYLDSLNEAYKVLVQQMGGTLVTVAKDVKLQVEFNPIFVEAYRLIGYENRLMANVDFNNDRKDAGDMGAGHTVTALYEIVPRGGSIPGPGVDPLKYQTQAPAPVPQVRNGSNEMLTLKIRYKDPNGTESKLMSLPLVDRETAFSRASVDFRFAASVAEFGMILRDSPYRGNATLNEVLDNAQAGRGSDRNGYRQEFIGLVQRARSIRGVN